MSAGHGGLEMVEEDAGFWRLELIAGVCKWTGQVERMIMTGAVCILLLKLQDSLHYVHDRRNDWVGRLLALPWLLRENLSGFHVWDGQAFS